MRTGTALVLTVFAIGACSSKDANPCTHPCDLASAFQVEIAGGMSASITVTGPCRSGSGGACVAAEGCRGAFFTVEGPGTCHLEAVSAGGQTFQRDLPVDDFTFSPCCPGYDIGWENTRITVTFPPPDAGAD